MISKFLALAMALSYATATMPTYEVLCGETTCSARVSQEKALFLAADSSVELSSGGTASAEAPGGADKLFPTTTQTKAIGDLSVIGPVLEEWRVVDVSSIQAEARCFCSSSGSPYGQSEIRHKDATGAEVILHSLSPTSIGCRAGNSAMIAVRIRISGNSSRIMHRLSNGIHRVAADVDGKVRDIYPNTPFDSDQERIRLVQETFPSLDTDKWYDESGNFYYMTPEYGSLAGPNWFRIRVEPEHPNDGKLEMSTISDWASKVTPHPNAHCVQDGDGSMAVSVNVKPYSASYDGSTPIVIANGHWKWNRPEEAIAAKWKTEVEVPLSDLVEADNVVCRDGDSPYLEITTSKPHTGPYVLRADCPSCSPTILMATGTTTVFHPDDVSLPFYVNVQNPRKCRFTPTSRALRARSTMGMIPTTADGTPLEGGMFPGATPAPSSYTTGTGPKEEGTNWELAFWLTVASFCGVVVAVFAYRSWPSSWFRYSKLPRQKRNAEQIRAASSLHE